MQRRYRLPFGAELVADGGTRFRIWAPTARRVDVVLGLDDQAAAVPLAAEADGWFGATIEAGAGARYRFRLDGGMPVPDPASRFQPDGVHAASEVIDPWAFVWRDGAWAGRPWDETVLYELHVGAFSLEGTFTGVEARLDTLAELGVTAVELMPVAATPGMRNWGYDGVYAFAPDRCYGRPEDLKALVQAAHARGLMVFLDVVYNHFGPEGNYLYAGAPAFFTDRYTTPWGDAINYDGPQSGPVRDFFIHNALYWIEEFHIDGLRLDAVHAICDRSTPDILTELAARVHAHVGSARHVHLVLENDHNAARYLERDAAGHPRAYVAQWNDDIHHVLHVLLTGEGGGYYADYVDAPVDRLGRALTQGFVYQGERSRYRRDTPRGEASAHLPPQAFVGFLQNHDQIGNRAFGDRIITLAAPEAVRAAAAVVLLAPSPPLLFMGEEWGCTQPFLFFCDFEPSLAPLVRDGRRTEFARFPEFADPASRERIPDPTAEATFRRAVLDWDVARDPAHRAWREFYRYLLRMRREHVVPRLAGTGGHAGVHRVLDGRGLRAEWTLGDGSRLHLLANMSDAPLEVAAALVPEGDVQLAGDIVPPEGPSVVLPAWEVVWTLARAGREAGP